MPELGYKKEEFEMRRLLEKGAGEEGGRKGGGFRRAGVDEQ